eukprot:jgi/Chrzof1/14194/Cz08g29020.t1
MSFVVTCHHSSRMPGGLNWLNFIWCAAVVHVHCLFNGRQNKRLSRNWWLEDGRFKPRKLETDCEVKVHKIATSMDRKAPSVDEYCEFVRSSSGVSPPFQADQQVWLACSRNGKDACIMHDSYCGLSVHKCGLYNSTVL